MSIVYYHPLSLSRPSTSPLWPVLKAAAVGATLLHRMFYRDASNRMWTLPDTKHLSGLSVLSSSYSSISPTRVFLRSRCDVKRQSGQFSPVPLSDWSKTDFILLGFFFYPTMNWSLSLTSLSIFIPLYATVESIILLEMHWGYCTDTFYSQRFEIKQFSAHQLVYSSQKMILGLVNLIGKKDIVNSHLDHCFCHRQLTNCD